MPMLGDPLFGLRGHFPGGLYRPWPARVLWSSPTHARIAPVWLSPPYSLGPAMMRTSGHLGASTIGDPPERGPEHGPAVRREMSPQPESASQSPDSDEHRCRQRPSAQRSRLLRSRAGLGRSGPAGDLRIRLRRIRWRRWQRRWSNSELCEAGCGQIWDDLPPRIAGASSRLLPPHLRSHRSAWRVAIHLRKGWRRPRPMPHEQCAESGQFGCLVQRAVLATQSGAQDHSSASVERMRARSRAAHARARRARARVSHSPALASRGRAEGRADGAVRARSARARPRAGGWARWERCTQGGRARRPARTAGDRRRAPIARASPTSWSSRRGSPCLCAQGSGARRSVGRTVGHLLR